jgi:metallo-beta-lactamase class B
MLSLALLAALAAAQTPPSSCANCAVWNTAQPPFRIYGSTYYVGPHGLSSILIASPEGHVLIDGALPESAPQIAANIRSLGFRIEDVKLILNTHVHDDHAGGIAELQKQSGARVAAMPWAAEVMRKGAVARDDPQFGTIAPITRVARVETIRDGQSLTAGAVTVTAHWTPGHTPGGTSWTWRSCENNRCLDLVYADSLSPISADGFKYSARKDYPNAEDFERSFTFLDRTPCDILITPHPDASRLWQRLEERKTKPDAMIDGKACKALAESAREQLQKRLASER